MERVDLNALWAGRIGVPWVERVDLNALSACNVAMDYPQRMHHAVPGWVKAGALFHIRIRVAPEHRTSLCDPKVARALLDAASRYHELGHWWCELVLLMPDHVHMTAAFPRDKAMSSVVRNWKRGTARFQRVVWQDDYFDHRLRTLEESQKTWIYIRRNPVVKGLCGEIDDWPHWRTPAVSGEAR